MGTRKHAWVDTRRSLVIALALAAPVPRPYAVNSVLGADNARQDVAETLGADRSTVGMLPSLSAGDVALVPGGSGYVVISGDIDGNATFGVTIMAEIVPRPENTGTVTFTPAPTVDIFQLDDPWPGAGAFSPFDTDLTGSMTLNGSVDDNGTFLKEPLVFSGALAAFPVVASADAEGIWDVVLSTSVGGSSWEGVGKILVPGTVRIVSAGDHNGDGRIDVADFALFQTCFTGSVGPVYPPGYPVSQDLCCNV